MYVIKTAKTKITAVLTALAMLFTLAGVLYIGNPAKTSAETFGDFEYEISNGEVTITDYSGPGGDIVIPGEIDGLPVTGIGNSAFEYCTSLTSIKIPNSVTSIGVGAFEDCTSLESVVIPDSVTSIEEYAFSRCTNLTSIEIPDSVTNIGNAAFFYCTSLTSVEIPDSVTSIGDGAFFNCRNLESIEIPDSVTSIGDGAFYDCWSLTSVTIPNGVTSIGRFAFLDCTSLTSIEIPDSVTSIGERAFGYSELEYPDYYGNYHIAYIRLDEFFILGYASTAAETYATENGFEFVSLGSVSILEGFEYEISNGEVTVTNYTGSGGDVVIPGEIEGLTVTGIGENAFRSCTSLTSIEIPNSVTSIGVGAFDYCESLTDVTIPDSVTSIEGFAFFYCTSLTSIEIPDGVTSIGDEAFFGCTSLTSVEIPDSVTSIGDSAFENCTSLTSVTIPDSVDNIKQSAFGYIYVSFNFEDVKIDNFTIHGYSGTAAETYATENGFEFVSLGDKPQVIPGDVNEDGEVTVADVVALANFLLDESSEINAEAADVYKDGKIDAKDLMYIVLKLSGKIKEFPAAA